MNIRYFYIASFMALMLVATYANATSTTSYTKVVHLRDGTMATCVVNGPVNGTTRTGGQSTLTTAQRNEAEVDATARLRRLPAHPKDYPTPRTAPRVTCS